jgi:hypothetical protein
MVGYARTTAADSLALRAHAKQLQASGRLRQGGLRAWRSPTSC